MSESTVAGSSGSSSSAAAPAAPSTVPPPTAARPLPRARPVRLTSSGSFHAGAPPPSFPSSYYGPADSRRRRQAMTHVRRQSTHMYHTFPTQPPKTPSDTADVNSCCEAGGRRASRRPTTSRDSTAYDATPLPVRQLALLALLSICEQTALNSIGPYLPSMVASFPEIPDGEVGLYVGLLASVFALAQLATNLFWGYLSDRVGRKPVLLLGTALLTGCFLAFGFCARYWQVLVVHIAMGLLNGNAAVVPTVLGEVTDRSNQSRAFIWLPVMYSLGGITGPALGGLLVGEVAPERYPFLGPNILSAVVLLVAVVVLAVWFEETLEDVDRQRQRSGLGWVKTAWARFGRSRAHRTPWNPLGLHWHRGHTGQYDSVLDQDDNAARPRGRGGDGFDEQGDTGDEDQALLLQHGASPPDRGPYEYVASHHDDHDHDHDHDEVGKASGPPRRSTLRQLLNWTTVSILITYLIFQIANIAFNSLYPIFASAAPPAGRALAPGTIGVCMSAAGLVTVLFQVSLFEAVKARLGNLGTFRVGLLGLALTLTLMPWVGYKDGDGLFGWGDGRAWLLAEVGVILVLKNLSAVGGLSCVLLLITNSAPSHETLGTLNGLAQSLSAAGRSFGPFASGALFTLATRLRRPKGEALAWGLFGGVALLGWLWSLTIHGGALESDDFTGDDDDNESGSDSDVGSGGDGGGGGGLGGVEDDDDATVREEEEEEEEEEWLGEPEPYSEGAAEQV